MAPTASNHRPRPNPRWGYTFVWGAASQVVSSVSNLLVVVVAANSLSAKGFGDFSFGYATVFFVLGLSRAFASEPVLSQGGHHAFDARRHLLLSVRSVGFHSLAAGAVIGGALSRFGSTPLLGVGALLVFTHDHLRHIAYARTQPGIPLAADLTWAAGTVVVVLQAPSSSPVSLLTLWMAAAGPACLVSALLLGWPQSKSGSLRPRTAVLPKDSTLAGSGVRLWFEYLLTMGVSYFGIIALRALNQSEAVGAIRGTLTLLAPVSLLLATFLSAGVPSLARQSAQQIPALLPWAKHRATQVSFVLSVSSVLLGALWLLLPDRLGKAVLGESWETSSALLPLMTAAIALGSLSNGPLVIMRALSLAPSSLRTRLRSSAAGLPIVATGAALGGARGYCIASIVAGAMATAIWWKALDNSVRQVTGLATRPTRPLD